MVYWKTWKRSRRKTVAEQYSRWNTNCWVRGRVFKYSRVFSSHVRVRPIGRLRRISRDHHAVIAAALGRSADGRCCGGVRYGSIGRRRGEANEHNHIRGRRRRVFNWITYWNGDFTRPLRARGRKVYHYYYCCRRRALLRRGEGDSAAITTARLPPRLPLFLYSER